LPLALGLRFSFSIELAGIYFRPSFHYGNFAGPLSLRDRVRQTQQKMLLTAAMRNRHLTTLFCLDPYSAPYVSRMSARVKGVALADPVNIEESMPVGDDRKRALGIEPGRQTMLLFGSLHARKGTMQVLDAVALLPPEDASRLCLVLAGRIPSSDKEILEKKIMELAASSAAHVVAVDRFLGDDEIRNLFAASDVILLPYQQHVGNSGVLMRAAAAGLPVLGPDYGVVGQLIRENQLGLAVDTTRPAAIAQGMNLFLSNEPSTFFDSQQALRLAERNSPRSFAETIFRHVGLISGERIRNPSDVRRTGSD
jgi:glycosyltransferase involved in cell wall biosynthesis